MTLTTQQVLSALPGNVYGNLQRADTVWKALRSQTIDPVSIPQVYTQASKSDRLDDLEYDVAIAGGTLGILLGVALVRRGWKVVVIERGQLQGRVQEWNISRRELDVLTELKLLTEEQLEVAIASEFNPVRLGFDGGEDIWVRDVLNVGVDPRYLLECLKTKFLELGGELAEQCAFQSAMVHENGVVVQAGDHQITARLLLDAMGHFSPIAKQARKGQRPDAVCVVVGTCAEGYSKNETGDLLVSFTPMANQCQYFWEAFPARDGRTTYMFSYLDAHPDRPSLETFFDEYLRLLPQYQSVELEQLDFKRALFGFFPCYRNSPLAPPCDRIAAMGDSSGSQSPLSFGGFGAMMRHLSRLDAGIDEALKADALSRDDLALLQPYQPNLSVTWLFQKSMSAQVGQQLPPDQINQLLVNVFKGMEQAGEPVLKPFLQDIVQFPALAEALLRTTVLDPAIAFKILPQVGLPAFLNWLTHYSALGGYSLLNQLSPLLTNTISSLSQKSQYRWHQRLQAWKYGSGGDFHS